MHVHSVPVEAQPEPCETMGRSPDPALLPYVVGYGGFRSGSGAPVRHRVLPLNLTTAIIDLTGEARVVTGPRATPAGERFDLLNALLRRWLAPEITAGPLVMHAWWRLQRDAGTHRVGALAAQLGVSRRHLELAFRREIGATPGTVARIARFQRANGMLAQRCSLSAAAAECGYADQPHLTREVRAMSGLTPTELFAFLQYRDLARG